MLKTEGPRCREVLPSPRHLHTLAPGQARPRAVPGVETRAAANGAEKTRVEELHLHHHPSRRRTALPGTQLAGETGQIYFLQKIRFLSSIRPPKPRVPAPEVPAHPARRRGWEPRALHRRDARPNAIPSRWQPAADATCQRPRQGRRARSCRGRKTLCISLSAPERLAAPDLGTSASSPRRGQGCLGSWMTTRGRGHWELHIKICTKKVPFPAQPHGCTSTSGSEQSVQRGAAVLGDAAVSPAWLCSTGDRPLRAGGRGNMAPAPSMDQPS